ncbi:MAG: aspartyl protease family protein [Lacipirellulaceae bacterium]
MFFTRCRASFLALLTVCCALPCETSLATGVPIEGFLPQVGFALTNEFRDDLITSADYSDSPGGILLGANDTAFYDIALLDTGAGLSLLTAEADTNFNIDGPYPGESDGFRGTFTVPVGGATGTILADVNDPVGLYAGGLQSRTGTGPLVIDHAGLEGQTNVSLITVPATSDLPNVVGLTFASQFATHINADQPQVFELNGRTVRTPAIDFQPLGSGGGSITRRAPLTLNPGAAFQQPPSWVFDFNNPDFLDNPHENPMFPTLLPGALFLTANLENDGVQLNNSDLFFDSGASVSVLSEQKALQLGIDVQLDTPDFSIDIIGSGGLTLDLPGYFLDSLTIQAIGGNVTANNVPVIIFDITNPGDPGNIVDGIIGTNLLVGRNLVIDPNPALGGAGASPSLYISDPVTTQHEFVVNGFGGSWNDPGKWDAAGVPDILGVANVRNNLFGNRSVSVTADAEAWELNISAENPNANTKTMTVHIDSEVTLTTFGGTNIEAGGILSLNGGTLDTQFVEVLGGKIEGSGTISTGSGPIPGQVENRNGIVSPGEGFGSLTIEGRYGNGSEGRMIFEIGGSLPGTEFDELFVDGQAKLGGTLEVNVVGDIISDYTPDIGDEFTIISTTEGIGGFFEELHLTESEDYEWLLEYGTNDVTLIVILPGDYNNDGGVNEQDVAAWNAGYAQQANFFDGDNFLTWQRNFGSGGIAVRFVPEPTSTALLLFAGSLTVTRRRRAAAN